MAEAVSAVENESDYSSKESEYDTEELAQLGALNLSESDSQESDGVHKLTLAAGLSHC